jgi:hypothetical protein
MRGSTRIGLLAVSLVCLFAFMVASAFADADDQLLDKAAGTALRDVKTEPSPHQPDALEFVNNGAVILKTGVGTITCTELEFGSTVLSNKVGTVELALPFGVAEGDNCTTPLLEKTENVPTYFDTLESGAVGNTANGKVASISLADSGAGTEIIATVHNLKFSQNIPTIGFCTGNVDGKTGTVTNVTAGFVEESTPNINVQFTKAKIPITATGGTGCPTTSEAELTANFLLETPSTTTDTAFFQS